MTGGDLCPGADQEAESCSASAPCPQRVSSSGSRRRQWSAWGEFSSCSGTCGGTRRRSRVCEGERGECWGSPSEVRVCGAGPCSLQPSSIEDRDLVTVIIGGFRDDWLQEVTLLRPDTGAVCSGPELPIWLADHFSVALGDASRLSNSCSELTATTISRMTCFFPTQIDVPTLHNYHTRSSNIMFTLVAL